MKPATSELYWLSALVTALVDVGWVWLLAWRISPARFRQLAWAVTGVAALFWGLVWVTMLWSYTWELAYQYVFPTWGRWVIPPSFAILFSAAGLGAWWLAARLPGNPVVNFCWLGGLLSLPGHLRAIYGMRMLDKVPILQGVSPASALVFGVFELILYWGLILAAAALLQRGWEWWSQHGFRFSSRHAHVA